MSLPLPCHFMYVCKVTVDNSRLNQLFNLSVLQLFQPQKKKEKSEGTGLGYSDARRSLHKDFFFAEILDLYSFCTHPQLFKLLALT